MRRSRPTLAWSTAAENGPGACRVRHVHEATLTQCSTHASAYLECKGGLAAGLRDRCGGRRRPRHGCLNDDGTSESKEKKQKNAVQRRVRCAPCRVARRQGRRGRAVHVSCGGARTTARQPRGMPRVIGTLPAGCQWSSLYHPAQIFCHCSSGGSRMASRVQTSASSIGALRIAFFGCQDARTGHSAVFFSRL